VSYESLTLDLFMLGYFQLLEMNMSRSERKFRHLLCYEMFDRLGSHKWEVIRQFHKEVMEEIERGKRDWADGFEDIKLKYFGDTDNVGGMMTASLRSMSPDIPIMPMQESLPPPPSHPPPPPPTHPAPPPPKGQTTAPALQPSSQDSKLDVSPSPAAPQDGVSDDDLCVELRTSKESLEGGAQENVELNEQMPSTASVAPNGTISEQNHLHNLTAESGQQAQALQDTTGSSGSGPKKDVPPVGVQIIEEPNVDKPPPRDEPTEDSIKVIYELKEFSNEEIIRYIDRSFAFWKEKEAELFDI